MTEQIKLVVCPVCNGDRSKAFQENGGPDVQRYRPDLANCSRCGGTGKVPAEQEGQA